MNIRKLKSLLWLTVFLALLLAGWTCWDIYQAKTKELRYEAKEDSHFADVLYRDVDENQRFNAGPTSYDPVDYEQIWQARIDGSVEPIITDVPNGPDPDAPPLKPELDKLDEVLQVGMLLWHSDPLSRLIAVEYMKESPGSPDGGGVKRRRLHLTEGESLRPPYDVEPYFGKVLRIGHQDVVFQWGEDEVTLTPGLDSSGDGMPVDHISFAEVEDLNEEFDDWPEDTTHRDDGSWILGLDDREAFADGGEQLQSQFSARSITPVGGGRSSIELTDVKPGSMLARVGLATGDRIISVNGHPMSSVAEGISWGKNHPDEAQYIVLYERRGVQETMTIHNKNK
jgi:hypothetical protein